METLNSFSKGMTDGLKEEMSGKKARAKKRKGSKRKSRK